MGASKELIERTQIAMDRHLEEWEKKHQTTLSPMFHVLTPENKALVNQIIEKLVKSQNQ